MKQTLLEPIEPHRCRICEVDYSIYGFDDRRICFDCDIGLCFWYYEGVVCDEEEYNNTISSR